MLDDNLKLSILSFMDTSTQSIALKVKNERLPPVKFIPKGKILESRIINEKDLEDLSKLGYIIKDSFLGIEKLHSIAQEAKSLYSSGKLKRAGMGTGSDYWKNVKIRSDYVLWLNSVFESTHDGEGVEAIRELIKSIDQIRNDLNEDIGLESDEIQMHLTCYPGEGARYMRHLDSYVGSSTRKITCLYYINPNWKQGDGGELRIFDPTSGEGSQEKKFTDIEPIGDRLLIFHSRVLEHEVLPTHAERFALTVWLY